MTAPPPPGERAPARRGVPDLGDFTTDLRVLFLALLSIVVACASVVSAWALLRLIAFCTNLAYHGHLSFANAPALPGSLPLWTVLVPVAGALIVGLMARYGSEKIRGHGIPEAMEAILIGQSRLSLKVAVLKPLSSAISIGSGGPFGAEGPIIMTGGAIGSLLAQAVPATGQERKTMLVAGAAGMTAVFGTPVAATLLAVELLLFEWKPRSFIPVATAAAVAAAARHLLLAPVPLFPFTVVMVPTLPGFVAWLALGVAAGLGSGVLTSMVYAAEDAFARLPIHWMWWPAIGGVVVGLGGLVEPQALGVGYENIRHLLAGDLLPAAVLLLLVVKAVIWAVALGSGTSGGVLAPLLIMGGALGALAGLVLPAAPPGFYALVGMAAMMGGTMRAPLTATLFAVELTHGVGALLPLLAACGTSYAVTVLLLKRSILTEKVARRGYHVSREYHVDPYALAKVSEIMVKDVDTLPADMAVADAVAFFMAPEPRHKSYPLLDRQGRLVGLLARADILRFMAADRTGTVGEAVAGRAPVVGYVDEMAQALIERMITAGAGRVPILDPETGALVGLVSRKDLLKVRARAREAERERTAALPWWRAAARTEAKTAGGG
jgi:chloride channel protein, CIC family